MADQRPTNKERVKEIVAGIEQNIQELFLSERYFDYLRTMSRFHHYSVNNTLLIHMQRPNASQPVAGFRKWQQFGHHVKKGEKGLTIIAPTPLKKKIEEMKLDPDTKAPMLDRDGKIIMEEKTVEIPLFKPVKVFSADQTDGKPLPSLAAPLTGNVEQYEAFMEALRRTSPMPISFAPLDPGTDGLCNFTRQTISIREGMSEVQTVSAAVHEIAHAVLHNREQDRLTSAAGTDKDPPTPKDNNTKEVEAESVSFAVCQYYGIDTSDNSMGYDELHGTRMFSEKEFARFMDLQLEGTKQPRDHTRGTFSQPETRKRVEKKSVLAKLSVPLPRREHKKSAPKKSAERDR